VPELTTDRIKLPTGALPDPWTTPLDELDVSDSRLYQQDSWRPYFERLRREDPVHFTAESPFGPYWSVTTHEDIRHVESQHEVFSSFPTIAIGDSPNDEYIENFIAMDPPKHEQQRNTVAGVVAPRNLVKLEPVIRTHVGEILDSLPDGGEVFDWPPSTPPAVTT
jgi:cytochrome P450